jgi:rhomboid protease GluP
MNEPIDPQPQQVSVPLPLKRPVATWGLLGIIAVVFLLEELAGGSTNIGVLKSMGAKVTPLIAEGEYWRLFTAMFLHIGPMHVLFNGYALVVLGTELERLLGWGRFLTIYLFSGLVGNLASYAFGSSFGVAAGASGAIFGLIGALGAFFFRYRERLGAWGRARLGNILFLVVINLAIGAAYRIIDNWAHLGGLLCGVGLGWALAPRYEFDPIGRRMVDRNEIGRYWPALALAAAILVGGTALVTLVRYDDPENHLQLGRYALEQGAWEEAISELKQVLAQDPTMTDAYFYLGGAYFNQGNYQLAAEAYESALALAPDDPSIHWNLASTYLKLGRYDEAQSQYEIYRRLNPTETPEADSLLDKLRRTVP